MGESKVHFRSENPFCLQVLKGVTETVTLGYSVQISGHV